MPSLNRVELIGHVGADPELKYTPSNVPVCNFSVATSWKNGEKEYTEWHRIVLWEKLAEITAERVHKGDLIYIEGRIQTRQFESKTGEKRYATDIVGIRVLFLERSEKASSNRSKQTNVSTGKTSSTKESDGTGYAAKSTESDPGTNSEDDVPF